MAIITTTQVKDYCGITGSSQDALISDLIDRATAWIEAVTGRVIEERTYTPATTPNDCIFDPPTGNILFLPHRPLTEVSSLVIEEETISTDDYVVYNLLGMIRCDNGFVGFAGYGASLQTIEVTYKAGYTAGNIPVAVQHVAIEIVADMLNQRSKDGTLIRETLGDWTWERSPNSEVARQWKQRLDLVFGSDATFA